MKIDWQNRVRDISLWLVFFLIMPIPTLIGKILISFVIALLYMSLVEWNNSHLMKLNRLFIFFFFFFSLASLLIVIFFPGGMISDSHFLFSMAYDDSFHAYRSRFLALIYQFSFLFHKSTLLILFTQVIIYGVAISLLCISLLKHGLAVPAIFVFLISFLPMFSGLVGVLCENTWISICYLAGVVFLYNSILSGSISNSYFVITIIFLLLGFFTRSYDIIYGYPLFISLFIILFKKHNFRNILIPSAIAIFLLLISHVGVTRLIDWGKGTIDYGQNAKFMNYYRALPVPYDEDIKLPEDVRKSITNHLRHKSRGWEAINDLADYSILVEGEKISKEEVVPEILEYMRLKPYLFFQGYLDRALNLLVIPHGNNWVTWTKFNPDHRLNRLDYEETNSYIEEIYIKYTDMHRKYAYIYQPIFILILSTVALFFSIIFFNKSKLTSIFFVGWASSGFLQAIFNILLAYHGAYRLYHWSVISSILVIVLIHATHGRPAREEFLLDARVME